MSKITKKETIYTIFLAIWMMFPVLKEIKGINTYIFNYQYLYMIIIGFIGLFCFLFYLIKYFSCTEDKKESLKNMLPILLFGIFMIWTLFSTAFSDNKTNALYGTPYRKDGYISYLAYAGFFSLAFLISSSTMKKIIMNLFIGTSILNIVLLVISNQGFCLKLLLIRDLQTTCFLNSNHYGYFLLLATVTANFLMVTSKSCWQKLIYLISYSFLLYFLILNNTFGAYLAFIITLLIFLGYTLYIKKNRKIAIASIVLFLLISLCLPSTRSITKENVTTFFSDIQHLFMLKNVESNKALIKDIENGGSGRIKLWKYGFQFFMQNPILGYGPENLESKYQAVGIEQDRPHNLIVQLATTSGIIGLLSYLSAIGIILIRGLKTMDLENSFLVISFACVIAYMISAMFGNSMYYTSPYFFIFLGILFQQIKQKTET